MVGNSTLLTRNRNIGFGEFPFQAKPFAIDVIMGLQYEQPEIGVSVSYRRWPNNPVELTAHSAGFWGYPWRFLLWAAAHRER